MLVLLIILALLLLIFAVPYGVDAGYWDETLRLSVKAGPLRLRLLPKKPLTPEQQAKKDARREKKRAKKAAKQAEKERKKAAAAQDETQKVPKKKELDVDFLLALAGMGLRAVRRFFGSFSIDLLSLHYTAASRDPYDTAMQYSCVCAALSALTPLSAQVLRCKKKDVCVDMDFTEQSPRAEGRLVISLQLYKIVFLAIGFGIEFLKWKKTHRKETAAAPERTEQNGRQQDQRDNGRHDDQDQAAG